MRNLQLLLNGDKLDERAMQLQRKRLEERESIQTYITQGHIEKIGEVHLLVTSKKIDAGLVPSFLPETKIIMVATPYLEVGRWQVALRLGLARPDNFTLNHIAITEFDPAYNGRWNAGSNRRGGGTLLSPHAYAQVLSSKLQNL